ncbi:uncharacterized protein METZ01_LOCUS187935, partial [marine metagenome]
PVRTRRRVGRKGAFTSFMVDQQEIWAAIGDMTIPKCHSAIPLGQEPGLMAGRLFLVIDNSQKLA